VVQIEMVMIKNKVRGIFFWKGKYSHWIPGALTLKDKLWWRFMPGVVINVKWPKGMIVAGPGPEDPRWYDLGGAAYITYESADPNDHYRPWMEKNVGKQGWDWNWGLAGSDTSENMLTIKFRKSKEQYATLAAIMWS
jgi:hypothetical protein